MQDAVVGTRGADRIVSNELAKELIDKLSTQQNVKQVPMVVANDTPFTVYLNGDVTTAVSAVPLFGSGMAAGTRGYAFWAPPLPPVAFAASAEDTGWVNLTYGAGFAAGTGGQLQYNVTGNKVTLRGGADHTTDFAADALIATLPLTSAGGQLLRPARKVRKLCYGTLRRVVSVVIDESTGAITANWPSPPAEAGITVLDQPWPTSWVALDLDYFTN